MLFSTFIIIFIIKCIISCNSKEVFNNIVKINDDFNFYN